MTKFRHDTVVDLPPELAMKTLYVKPDGETFQLEPRTVVIAMGVVRVLLPSGEWLATGRAGDEDDPVDLAREARGVLQSLEDKALAAMADARASREKAEGGAAQVEVSDPDESGVEGECDDGCRGCPVCTPILRDSKHDATVEEVPEAPYTLGDPTRLGPLMLLAPETAAQVAAKWRRRFQNMVDSVEVRDSLRAEAPTQLHQLVCGRCHKAITKGQQYAQVTLPGGRTAPVHGTCMEEGSAS